MTGERAAAVGAVSQAAGWRRASLASLCIGIFDCPHSTPDLAATGPYLARTQDVRDGVFRLDEAAHVSQETYRERIARAVPSPGDLLYSREGTYFGVAAEVPLGIEVCLGQRMVLIRPDPVMVDTRFLRYWLNSPRLAAHVRAHRDGSVAERLNLPTIRALPVAVPPVHEQHLIAGILGALDDKIDLNRVFSRGLREAMQGAYQMLMADESAAGAGWLVTSIGDLAEIVGGSTPSTAEPNYWDHGIHGWATPKDLSRLPNHVLLSTERRISSAGLAQISSGLLPVGTVLMSSRAPIGYLAICEVPVAINQGFIAMKPRSGVSNLFLLCWVAASQDEILRRANGSTFLEVSKAAFRPIEVRVPPPDRMAAFDDMVRPLHERIVVAERACQTLQELRDSLLPRLLSGELEVAA